MMQYRREIDGLRAIAVLPVILFHAGFETFGGGFVGVDVFFVISGYLITTIILSELEQGKFSIVNFYERRARRILPALYFLLFSVSVVATIIMLPSQLKDYGQSVLATITFLSNVYFYLKIDYWAQSSEFLPLLHTWSLGVEEQYYLLFPIFLYVGWKFGQIRVFTAVALIAVASLLLSEWGWRNNAAGNFYLAPYRAWELLAGSIGAFIVQKYGVKKNNLISFIGLMLIFLAIFIFDKTTPFPSFYALIPVMGALLLILYADKQTLVARFLSINVFVAIGLMSYSAYLWHQPILALYRIYNSSIEFPATTSIALVFLTLGLAYLSYRFVELPFRNKNSFSSKAILYLSIIPLFFFGAYGIFMHLSDGLKEIKFSALSPQVKSLMERVEYQQVRRSELWSRELNSAENSFPNNNKLRILFLGDSLSQDLYVTSTSSELISNIASVRRLAFDDECAKGLITNGNEVNHNGRLCSESLARDFQSNLFKSSEVVVIASAWLSNAKYLEALLNRAELRNKKVVVYKSHSFSTISSLIMSLDGKNFAFSDPQFTSFIYLNKHSRTVIANSELESISRSRSIPTLNGFDAFVRNVSVNVLSLVRKVIHI